MGGREGRKGGREKGRKGGKEGGRERGKKSRREEGRKENQAAISRHQKYVQENGSMLVKSLWF